MQAPELDVLVVAPHPDDAELGMGGTLLRYKQEGRRVGILDLTSGEPTPLGSVATRAAESDAAGRVLGIDWRHNLGLPNRSLEPTLEARRRLAGVLRLVRPQIVFAPYWVDAHPDHLAAVQLVEAACFWTKLSKSDLAGSPCPPPKVLHYYCVHLELAIQPDLVVDISPFWETKRRALECYHSQFLAGRPDGEPTVVDKMHDQARYWGWAIRARYGEPFASREPLGLRSLRDVMVRDGA